MKNKILVVVITLCVLAVSNFCTGFTLVKNEDEGTKYCGFGNFTSESETINYSRKETVSYNIKGEVPNFIGQMDNANCANIAGTILITYYDRFCENLIPDYKAYVQIGSVIKYRVASKETEAVMTSLYDLMETNVGTAGTTFAGFHKGMKSYVNNHGLTYSYEDIGNIDLAKFKASVENNRPVALFLSNYSFLVTGEDTGTVHTINSSHSTVAHVVAAYGYRIDTYYNSSNQVIATRTYLKVASGLFDYGLTYLCLDGKSTINRASSIIIN